MKTFRPPDPQAIAHFVREGYAVYRGVFERRDLLTSVAFIKAVYRPLLKGHTVHEAAVQAMDAFQKLPAYDRITAAPLLTLQQYLGPDVCALGYDALWINVPQDKDPVLLKGIHNDAWSGTSVNTIFAKVFFTDCDRYNGLTMYPGSHLQGMIPVRNRAPDTDATFKAVNLICKAGDLVIWHPLTLHSTTGHSDKNVRISMTSRYTSTETAFSSQERALGYRTLSVGPMNQILRLVGNDYLTPLRTYGGVVAIDKRMRRVYGG